MLGDLRRREVRGAGGHIQTHDARVKTFFGLLLIRQILGLQSKSNGRAESLIYFYMIQRGLFTFSELDNSTL